LIQGASEADPLVLLPLFPPCPHLWIRFPESIALTSLDVRDPLWPLRGFGSYNSSPKRKEPLVPSPSFTLHVGPAFHLPFSRYVRYPYCDLIDRFGTPVTCSYPPLKFFPDPFFQSSPFPSSPPFLSSKTLSMVFDTILPEFSPFSQMSLKAHLDHSCLELELIVCLDVPLFSPLLSCVFFSYLVFPPDFGLLFRLVKSDVLWAFFFKRSFCRLVSSSPSRFVDRTRARPFPRKKCRALPSLRYFGVTCRWVELNMPLSFFSGLLIDLKVSLIKQSFLDSSVFFSA